jgi:hypothetical protein
LITVQQKREKTSWRTHKIRHFWLRIQPSAKPESFAVYFVDGRSWRFVAPSYSARLSLFKTCEIVVRAKTEGLR